MALVFLSVLVMAAVALVLPAATKAVERARVEREVTEASWRIHQQATQAFGEMLEAARQAEDAAQATMAKDSEGWS